jgi:hypothetical protein
LGLSLSIVGQVFVSALIGFDILEWVDDPTSQLQERRSLPLPAQIFKGSRAEIPSPAKFNLIEVTHESFSVLRRTCKNREGNASVLNQQNLVVDEPD